MTRANITPELLRAKGYREYEFSDMTMEQACEYIRKGGKCRLIPDETGAMVGAIGPYGAERHVFYRPMTEEELATYHDWMVEEWKRSEKASDKRHARHIAKMRRCRR